MTATAERERTAQGSQPQDKAAPQARTHRLWEIDTLRGVAVITMIIYHLGWDLYFFQAVPGLNPYTGFWYLLQRYTCISFILLAGLSLTLQRARLERQGVPPRTQFFGFARRGLWVFGWGMVITLVMWLSGIGRIDFGVLHLIGFSIIAAFPFLRFKWLNLALWALLFVLGGVIIYQHIFVNTRALVWLGLYPMYYTADDYFPIIPWFGVALLGVFFGNLLYPNGQRIVLLPDWSAAAPVRGLRWLGSHSLPIYLLHQPVLFALLWALGIARF